MKITLSILILTLTSFFCASAQKPCFEHLNINDGLSLSTVNEIRAPLTLIKGPLDNILSKDGTPTEQTK